MNPSSRKQLVFTILGGFFISNAILAELIGGKIVSVDGVSSLSGQPLSVSVGIIPLPVVFLMTDLVNEYFGKEGVKKLTFLTVGLIIYTLLIIYIAMGIPAAEFSPVKDEAFRAVFGQSLWIIVGSITAFLTSQLVDVLVFWFFRNQTGGQMLWLRATGSTAVSQLIDTFIVIGIAFWLPGKFDSSQYLQVSIDSYTYKLAIAIGITPLIYLLHGLIDWYLAKDDGIKHNL